MNAIYPGESKMTPHTLVVSRNQSSSKEGKIGKIFWILSRESNDSFSDWRQQAVKIVQNYLRG